jgi:hypothetical protein
VLLVVLFVLARPPQAANCATQRNLTDAGATTPGPWAPP